MGASTTPYTRKVRFGLFEVDFAAGQLRKQGRPVKLQELPLRVLTSLLESPGELVTHERLHEKVWGGTVVDYEDGLHTAVRKLRDALGDSAASPLYIVTIPRRGYRFIAPVSAADGDRHSLHPTYPSWVRLLLGALVVVTLLAMLFMFLWLHGRSSRFGDYRLDGASLPSIAVTSYPGLERSPSISPDGQWVAFAWNGDRVDNLDIYVQRIEGGLPIRLTTDAAADDYPTWSPDGGRIAFTRGGSVFLVPSVGGQQVRLTGASGAGLAWRPDGSLLAISNRDPGTNATSILLVTVGTGAQRKLTSPSSVSSDELPAFSWDGMQIAFVRRHGTVSEVYSVAAGGGPARQLTTFGQPISGLTFRPDNEAVVFGGTGGLFAVPVSSRGPQPPQRLALSDAGIGQPVFSPPARNRRTSLVFSWFPTSSKIWGMPIGRSGLRNASPARIASSNLGDWAPAISPEGKRIAFCSRRSGSGEIWISDIDGANSRQLTTFGRGPGPESLSWCPDGDLIAFDATVDGNRDVYIVRADGAAVTRLTDGPSEDAQPSWSRDHPWIYFASDRSGTRQIWKMRGDGSQPAQLTKGSGYQAVESPDGRSVWFTKDVSQPGLWSVPVNGGNETLVIASVRSGSWGVARDGLYYVDFDHSAPSKYPVNWFDFRRWEELAITTIPMCVPRDLQALAVRADGAMIAWTSSGERNSDLKLVPDFRW